MDLDQYCAYLALQGLADSTIRVYRALVVRWLDWAAANEHPPLPSAIGVRRWTEQTVPASASSRAAAKAAIGHLCAALHLEDLSTVIRTIRDPRRGKTPRLSGCAVAGVLEVLEDRGLAGLAVAVGLYSGARRSEIATLRWDRIDWRTGTVTLWRPKSRDLHPVPLHPELERLLAARRDAGGDWVFPGRHGGHVSYAQISTWVAQVGQAAGVGHVAPHQLRVEFACRAYEASLDLRAVQDLMGHRDPRVTSIYARVASGRLAEVVAAIDHRTAA